jgi:hypothetical protein
LGKGQSKGKGKDKKPLDCHNCAGIGHPMRLCTSPQWAKSTGGSTCDNCKGFGHTKSNFPSPGGAKQIPPNTATGKGAAKGKGKGKGKSTYFAGKGSGRVSLLDNDGYSEADWAAWTSPLGTNQQQQQHAQQQQQQQQQHQQQQNIAHSSSPAMYGHIDTMTATPWPGASVLMPWMTNSGESSSAGSGIASVAPGQSGIRNMYSLGAKNRAPTTTTTTTTSTRTTSTTPAIGESFVVPLADLIKHRYINNNKNRKCKKREAEDKEEDDNDAMRPADQACFVKDRSAVTANALPLYADSETTSHCTTSHDDFATSVPAVKTNAFPLYVYSEDKVHPCVWGSNQPAGDSQSIGS